MSTTVTDTKKTETTTRQGSVALPVQPAKSRQRTRRPQTPATTTPSTPPVLPSEPRKDVRPNSKEGVNLEAARFAAFLKASTALINELTNLEANRLEREAAGTTIFLPSDEDQSAATTAKARLEELRREFLIAGDAYNGTTDPVKKAEAAATIRQVGSEMEAFSGELQQRVSTLEQQMTEIRPMVLDHEVRLQKVETGIKRVQRTTTTDSPPPWWVWAIALLIGVLVYIFVRLVVRLPDSTLKIPGTSINISLHDDPAWVSLWLSVVAFLVTAALLVLFVPRKQTEATSATTTSDEAPTRPLPQQASSTPVATTPTPVSSQARRTS
ncbi:MAG: hypothetical protein JWN33_216 [Candidatus Saccharibacteria bacterium]|nr:hypothetical protein [Candidatus Saccharibacteria bacterium]